MVITKPAPIVEIDSDQLLPKPAPLGLVPLARLATPPLVSVIVPSYNQGRFVRDTIDSILSQDYRPIEIHVVDGGSQDETVEVLESYGKLPELHWVSERDRGVVHAVNKGFARVTGQIVAIQSSDDMYVPGVLSTIVAEFKSNPNLGLVYGDTIKVDANGGEIARDRIGPYSLENLFLLKTWIPQPSTFFRRELLDVVGGWDADIPYAPDTDLWIRMAMRTGVKKLDDFLSQRRMHDAQRDTQEAKIVRDYTKMIAQSRDLSAADEGLRRAALASPHLIRERYRAGASDWEVAWHLLRAGLICPQAFKWSAILRYGLMPGRRFLSRLKRRLVKNR